MASVNKAIVLGNLGRDPEVRFLASGSAVCTISVATSRNWKDKTSGEKREEVEWHRITFFDRLAEVVGEYLKKGSAIYVEGRLQTRKYTDKDGVEKYSTEIIAQEMQMLGGKGERDENERPAERAPAPARSAPAKRAASEFDNLDDDIPF